MVFLFRSWENSSEKNKRATTKGQNRLGTFSHFFGTFSHFFRDFQKFSPGHSLRIKGFCCCFSSKRRKENKSEYKEKDQTILHVSCCTFVLLRIQEVSEYGFVCGSKLWKCRFSVDCQLGSQLTKQPVALYRAMRLRFGYGFESRNANSPRNVKSTNLAKPSSKWQRVFYIRWWMLAAHKIGCLGWGAKSLCLQSFCAFSAPYGKELPWRLKT